MTLKEWLVDRRMSHEEFGRLIERDKSTVTRYVNGRMPRKPDLVRIKEVTAGAVTADDFMDQPVGGDAAAASNGRAA